MIFIYKKRKVVSASVLLSDGLAASALIEIRPRVLILSSYSKSLRASESLSSIVFLGSSSKRDVFGISFTSLSVDW